MANNTESDGTYCSDVENKDRSQIRRSKRLSQRNHFTSFRFIGDPNTQRLYEIYQMLKCGKLCSKWLIEDWQTLKLEVELIKKTLNGKQKGRISFILKQISTHLQPNKSPVTIQPNQNDEQVKSPNILAGMMTEVLTEIPPYQPDNVIEITRKAKYIEPSIGLTQKNPLDLTKKDIRVTVALDKVLSQNFSEMQNQQRVEIGTPIRAGPLKTIDKNKTPKVPALCISKDSTIDLIEENAVETNRENIVPISKRTTVRPKSQFHVSKWFQFLPTQQRPTCTLQPLRVRTTTTDPKKNPTTLKDSVVKLNRDQPTSTTSISNTTEKSFATSCPKKTKTNQKSKSSPIRYQLKENLRQKPFRNTERIVGRDPDLAQITPRDVQSENVCNNSPDFLLDEFLELTPSDMNDSGTSLTPSLKESFKKIFGTDNLRDVFGNDEMVYNLNENHVRRLAMALKVEYHILKKTIDDILANDNYGFCEDDMIRSDSSVIECSQSPPQRRFPSQRSQT